MTAGIVPFVHAPGKASPHLCTLQLGFNVKAVKLRLTFYSEDMEQAVQ